MPQYTSHAGQSDEHVGQSGGHAWPDAVVGRGGAVAVAGAAVASREHSGQLSEGPAAPLAAAAAVAVEAVSSTPWITVRVISPSRRFSTDTGDVEAPPQQPQPRTTVDAWLTPYTCVRVISPRPRFSTVGAGEGGGLVSAAVVGGAGAGTVVVAGAGVVVVTGRGGGVVARGASVAAGGFCDLPPDDGC